MTRKCNWTQVCLGGEALPNLPTNRCKVPMGSTWPGLAPDPLQSKVLTPRQRLCRPLQGCRPMHTLINVRLN